MILPAPVSNFIMNRVGSGDSGGGGGTAVLQINVHAIDAKGMEAVMEAQAPAILKNMKRLMRQANFKA